MIPGVTGALVSLDVLEHDAAALRDEIDETRATDLRRRLQRWHMGLRNELGPATSARTCFDRLAAPLFTNLGYRLVPTASADGRLHAVLLVADRPVAAVVVTAWGLDPGSAWRQAVFLGIAHAVRWSFICSGPQVRVVDAERTYSRRHLDLDLETTMDDDRAFAVLWRLLRAEAMDASAGSRVLERAIAVSERHRAAVRSSLQKGVLEALQHLAAAFAAAGDRRCRRSERVDVFHESLVVIYRVLFLLFAEARGLVPRWHPVYRDGYTIESLRGPIEQHRHPPGVWEALQAMSRLAHRGCQVGSLRVPPFNGHLFAPSQAPLADALLLDDGTVRQALLALTTRPGRTGRTRIAYGDLGVEQLGGVYEHLLDFQPTHSGRGAAPLLVRTEARKRTGSFYTPRSLTEYLVRRTLAPLVDEASSGTIMNLRVLDPAMGSGAFLVAACRYLAGAYESALIREGSIAASEVGPVERASFRRAITQRCLYGVDLNPMAVQLGRLSLWLATLAADRPLTFLDHRLRTGNSLVGASPVDITRQPSSTRGAPRRPAALPLFSQDDRGDGILEAIAVREAIACEPGDTLEQVRRKERALADLDAADSQVRRWRDVLDLWCAGWFPPGPTRPRVAAAFGTLADRLLGRGTSLPDHLAEPLLHESRDIARRERFFHWTLEYPEVFFGAGEQPSPSPGFDAVIGNPPWEMLRADRGTTDERRSDRAAARAISDFVRSSGIYHFQGNGHTNLYQLFLERSSQLVRRGGRLGLVMPSGLATDVGSAALRRMILDRTTVDGFVGIENRDGVFPIHRGLKFLLLCATASGTTTAVPLRLGIRTPEALDRLPELDTDPQAIRLPRGLIERLSGPALAIPDLRSTLDVSIASSIAFAFPCLGDAAGWHVRFGRELNASDDRRHFSTSDRGLPVLEGKHIRPFGLELETTRFRIARRMASTLLDPERTFQRRRLAYRDVASATNRLTLIAAIVPPDVVTTHTLFCLKDRLDDESQEFLCGVLNSYVANYLVRLRVGTHVSAVILDRLPVPRPPTGSADFRAIAALSRQLGQGTQGRGVHARLQGRVGRLYGLNPTQFARILDTFPLVPRAERDEAWAAFCDIVC